MHNNNTFLGNCLPTLACANREPVHRLTYPSLGTSSRICASETSLARTRERAAKPRGVEEMREARLASLAEIGELARRLPNPALSKHFALSKK